MKLRLSLLLSMAIVTLNAQTRALSVNTRHVMLNNYNAGSTKFIRYGLDFSFGTGEGDLEATVKDSLLQDSLLYDIDTKFSSAGFGLGFQKGRRLYDAGNWGLWGVWTVRLVSKNDRSNVFPVKNRIERLRVIVIQLSWVMFSRLPTKLPNG